MIRNNQWIPEVPRPTLTDERFEQFLKKWVYENYDFRNESEAEKSRLYHTILNNWYEDNEEMAEYLLECGILSYREAKEFEDKNLSYDISMEEKFLVRDWVVNNNYTQPFPVGSQVKVKLHIGDLYGLIEPASSYCNLQGLAKILANNGKFYEFKWEDLILVGSEK